MGSGFTFPRWNRRGKNAWWEVFLWRFVEPLPLQVFPWDDIYSINVIRHEDVDDEEEGRTVRGLQIMMGQQELLEVLAQGDLFI